MNKAVMFGISYGLYILSAKDGEKDNGCVINTLQQVTDSPNRISITVNKQNYTCEMIEKTGMFNVSLLSTQTPFTLFQEFGFQSGRTVEKFAKEPLRAPNGIAYVGEVSCGWISGKVTSTVDLGTHMLFIADVTDGEVVSDGTPLTYAYYHKHVKPAPAPAKKSGWICKICNYVHESDDLPADIVCPLCKHGAEDFVKL